MYSPNLERQTDPRYWSLKQRLNWQQMGLYQPYPKLAEWQFRELLAADGEELRRRWRALAPELRMQMLTQQQREWLMDSRLNLNLRQAERDTDHPSRTSLNGNSPIGDWLLCPNQSVTPDEHQAALQKLAVRKNTARPVWPEYRERTMTSHN